MSLQTRDVRALVIGLAVMGGLLVGAKGFPFLRTRLEIAVASRQGTERTHLRERWLIEVAPEAARLRAASSERRATLERIAFPGGTPAEAAASAGMMLEQHAQRAGVRVISTSPTADTSFTVPYPRLAVRAYATADVQGVLQLLAALESSTPRLIVREFTVTQPEPSASQRTPENLRVELVLEALARAGTALGGASNE
jgi:hypothetical protein